MTPSALTRGQRVIVTTFEQWEALTALPAALHGEYDPSKSLGFVRFASIDAARDARRKF